MTRPRSVIDRIREKGEEVLSQISNEVVNSPYFAKAMQGAVNWKERLDEAVEQTLKRLSIPTRTEFRKAVERIHTLEREVADLKAAAAAPPRPAKPRVRRPRRTPPSATE